MATRSNDAPRANPIDFVRVSITLGFMRLDQALTDREIDELAEFLGSEGTPDEWMDISILHGFLTALVVGPAFVPPSEWLPLVWGGDGEPDFKSEDEALRISGLILRLYSTIENTLEADPEEFQPIVFEREEESEEEDVDAEGWCAGFALGMRMRLDEWQPILEDDEGALLMPIIAAFEDEAMQDLAAEAAELNLGPPDLAEMIPISVGALYEYWKGKRTAGSNVIPFLSAVPSRPAKTGRNEPCPCGSGKKYKKCCGRAGAPN